MINKAKVFFAFFTILLISNGLPANAGVLENLDKELTDLVKSVEPFLVTIEAEDQNHGNVYVGSGILIDKNGHVLTTTSVIDRTDKIAVSFKDGEKHVAQYLGADYQTGLALLKIAPVDRKTPAFGDPYKLNKGSWIVVVGNSYDMPNAVDFGVFSGMTDEGFLQLSVQSGPGSSGGAVFNTRGEMVGLVVAQASETVAFHLPLNTDIKVNTKSYNQNSPAGDQFGIDMPSSGTSLAVPADKISNITSQLINCGEVSHGFLGIKQKPLTQKQLDELGVAGGIEIADVSENTPAKKAGLQKGDIIVKVDGRQVKGTEHFYSMIRSHLPKDEITLEVIRFNSTANFKIVLGKAGNDGYLGFLRAPRRYEYDFKSELSDLGNKLSDTYNSAKENFAKLDSLKSSPDFEDVKNQLNQLKKRLNELSAKVDDLAKESENK